jgi:hypothetical protein
MPRAIVYTAKTTDGAIKKIVLDMTSVEDFGIEQARSQFVHDSIVKGYELDYASITRTEVGQLPW